MTSEPILSVIIPVFRTEAYLRACLASVAEQSLADIEVIVVNDGSPDDCQSIINAYEFIFGNFQSIETSNQGQSAARNTGLAAARGKYVAFLDSDDRVPPEAYEALVGAAERSDAEICVGVAESFNPRRAWVNPQMRELYDCVASHAQLSDLLPLVRDASPCNKVFARSLLEREQLQFPVGIGIREDLHLVLQAFVAANAITVIPSTIYNYRARGDSRNLSRTEEIHAKVFDDLLWVYKDVSKRIADKAPAEVLDQLHATFVDYIAYRVLSYVQTSETVERERVLESIRQFLLGSPFDLATSVSSEVDRLTLQLIITREWHALEALALAKDNKQLATLPEQLAHLQHRDTKDALSSIRASHSQLTRKSPVGQRLRKLRKQTTARGRRAISLFEVPKVSPGAVAREARLARARGRRAASRIVQRSSEDIWVIGERRGLSAEDTGFAFFRHLRTSRPDMRVYFITRSGANGAKEASKLGNVLRYGSTDAYEKILHAKVLAYSDNGQDLFHRWPRVAKSLQKDVFGCFLQHGVIGLHAMGDFYSKAEMEERGECFDLFITSSESEKKNVTKHLGFRDEEVAVTGLSRFDGLSVGANSPREILYMPSWRQWLRNCEPDEYLRSDYFLSVQNLISDTRLHQQLEQHDFRLVLAGHFAMAKHAGAFRSNHPRVEVLSARSEPLQHYIKRARLLLTDYSSVSYDVAYQRRPILYYQFDAERFYQTRGMMLIDPSKELFGESVRSHEELLAAFGGFFAGDHAMPQNFRDRAESFFPFFDTENSERIYNAIQDRRRTKGFKV